ncbi:unnamed protein product [Ixodes persulcatus]
MSNIYIQEPPTSGKVLLKTTVGDIDVELWSKETPKACRNFVQLCLDGYYNGTIFHRVVKGFIAQGGDPTGTGEGGESIYGAPFKDEFHTRLRFVRRGLVAMASGGADDNGSQFFFTLGATPDLQNKHTVFGKVAGNTLYNMLRLEEGLVDSNDRPLHPHKIISTEVLVNPFEDLVAREKERVRVADEERAAKEKLKSNASAAAAAKNYKLLSFGEEAEEDEMELDAASKDQKGKSKSSHDLTDDPGLSSVPVVDPECSTAVSDDDDEETTGAVAAATAAAAARVRQKFKDGVTVTSKPKRPKEDDEIEEEEVRNYFEDERRKASAKKIGEIRKEFRQLKREMRAQEEARQEKAAKGDGQEDEDSETEEERRNALFKAYRDEQRLYAEKKKTQLKKGSEREQQTLAALAKFQAKLKEVQEREPASPEKEGEGEEEEEGSDRWLAHALHFEEQGPVLARDAANVNPEEAYDISDPRNAMNQRRRDRKRKNHHSERRH